MGVFGPSFQLLKMKRWITTTFFMTLTLFTGFIEYAYNPRDEKITIFSFFCSVFASWVGYKLIQNYRNLKRTLRSRLFAVLRRDLKEKTDLKNKLTELP